MRLSCIGMVLLTAATCVAAPVERMIEDFEGGIPELAADAEIIEVEGNHLLRWTPDGKQPWFLNLDFTGAKLDDWDRLELSYRIDGLVDLDQWGVKLVDYPFGDGYQVPYVVAGDELVLGEWATAKFTLHPVPDRWSSPREDLHQIILRAHGASVGDEGPVFLVDDIRVVRDALHLSVELGDSHSAGAGWRRDFTIEVRSAAEQPLTVSFEGRDVPDGAVLELPEPVELPAGERREVTASMSIPGGLASLTQIEASFVAISDDDDHVEEALIVSVPLPEIEHPVLLMTRNDLPRIRERIETLEWAREAWEPLLRSADEWVARQIELPDRGGQWPHYYTCEECGASLRTISPTEHVCPSCDAEYTGWPYDDVVIMREHNALANAVRELGIAYAITEDDHYAAKARAILLRYADVYLGYPLHNRRNEDGHGAVHIGSQPLCEATWLIPIAQGFDCVYHTLSHEEQKAITEKVLVPAAELIRPYAHHRTIHNIACWLNSAIGLVGIVTGNQDIVAEAINGKYGFRAQIEQGVDDEGVWFEGSWGYHYYTMSALEPLAVAAENIGIDLYCERYLGMFTAPVGMMGPTGTLPAFNDAGRSNALGSSRAPIYEKAASRWDCEEIALVLGSWNRTSYEALLWGPDEVSSGTANLTSNILRHSGVAMLRTDVKDRPEGLIPGVPANSLALGYGPHGGGHGHPDKLGFELHVLGRLFLTDAGSVQYGNPAQNGWYRQTLSHNTVVVDGVSQQPTEGKLLFEVFTDQAAVVGAESDGAYRGVTLRRFMALLPEGLLDITVALSAQEHCYDWALHGRGDLQPEPEMTELDAAPGEGAYEWGEDWRTAGELARFAGDWVLDDDLAVRIAQTASPSAEVFTAIGRGTPSTMREPFIMSRVNATNAAWATAAWWDGSDGALSVRLLYETRDGANLRVGDAVGVEVTIGNRRLVLMIADGAANFDELSLDGTFALVEFDGDGQVRCLAAQATELTIPGFTY